ncbi:MAG: F0F1 ATP synthase subunit gamma [Alphaproteobacteria bacterium]
MASLKDLKSSILSVQSTKRITSAMKMVASAKLKKATDNVEESRPYVTEMSKMITNLSKGTSSKNPLLVGTGQDKVHLFVVVSSDRGLCGGFNSNLARRALNDARALKKSGKKVKFLIVGRKANVIIKNVFENDVVEVFEELNKPVPEYQHAKIVSSKIIEMLNAGEFDICTMYYNVFVNALEQRPTPKQIIPLASSIDSDKVNDDNQDSNEEKYSKAIYEYDPNEDAILMALLPKNLIVQLYSAMLESFAGEQAARMTAMDNATNNAGDMIHNLQIKFNRTRQAQITGELIEIISGAEAL